MSESRTDIHVLVVDDEPSLRFTLGEALRDTGYTPIEAADGGAAFAALREHPVDLVLLDLRLQASGENGITLLKAIKKDYPDVEVVMMTAHGNFNDAVEATKAGCFQFLAKPFQLDQIQVVLAGALESARLRREVEVLRRASRTRFPTDHLVGTSSAFTEAVALVQRVAQSKAAVLLLGETGAGKEVFARAVHRESDRESGPLVELNCSAVPESLLESELFGHEKGAFTDAKDRKKGVFELADEGTLFLDEIGDMHIGLQAKLLRVLETGTFKRVGGTVNLEVDVRVVAATNRDLQRAVQSGTFREDLYYRLAVVPVHIPPLRDRRADIVPLAHFFLNHLNGELGTSVEGFTSEAEAALSRYRWPGNVRELRNVVERAVLLCNGPTVAPDSLPPEVMGVVRSPDASSAPAVAARADADADPPVAGASEDVWSLADAERFAIERALRHHSGNKTRAAEALGISRGTLRTKLRQYGLEPAEEPTA